MLDNLVYGKHQVIAVLRRILGVKAEGNAPAGGIGFRYVPAGQAVKVPVEQRFHPVQPLVVGTGKAQDMGGKIPVGIIPLAVVHRVYAFNIPNLIHVLLFHLLFKEHRVQVFFEPLQDILPVHV